MSSLFPRLRARCTDEGGAALIEFALVLPLLLILMLGMVDFGKAFNYWIDETHLAHSGSRWAAVNKNPGPGGTLQESIRDSADTSELRDGGTNSIADPLQVCVSFPNGTSNVGDPVRITVSSDYNFLNFLGTEAGITGTSITGSSTMRLEQTPTNYSAGCS